MRECLKLSAAMRSICVCFKAGAPVAVGDAICIGDRKERGPLRLCDCFFCGRCHSGRHSAFVAAVPGAS